MSILGRPACFDHPSSICCRSADAWAASLVVFLGTQLLPGDAAQAALGQTATPQLVEALRKDLGLNRPVLVRYWEWLGGSFVVISACRFPERTGGEHHRKPHREYGNAGASPSPF